MTRIAKLLAEAAPVARARCGGRRDLVALPKAHLHLHFTGSLRPPTLLELAAEHRVRLPDTLRQVDGEHPPELRATDERGWFRFQRLYDAARAVVRGRGRRPPAGAARPPRTTPPRGRAGWRSRSTRRRYAPHLGGLTPAVELVLDAAREAAARRPGVGVGVIIAANRTRHPLDARTLARLAAQYAGAGVVGLRAVQRRAARAGTEDFARAFRIAARGRAARGAARRRAGRAAQNVRDLPGRAAARTGSGHGVRAVEDPALLDGARRPTGDPGGLPDVQRRGSGSTPTAADVPLRTLRGGRRAGRAGRGRPAAVRLPAGRPVRGWRARCTASPTRSWPSWPGARCEARWRPRTSGPGCWPASTTGWPSRRADQRRQSVEADQDGLVVQLDAEALADAGADLAGQGQQVGGGRAAAVGEGERVLGGEPGRARRRSPCRTRPARSARRPRS